MLKESTKTRIIVANLTFLSRGILHKHISARIHRDVNPSSGSKMPLERQHDYLRSLKQLPSRWFLFLERNFGTFCIDTFCVIFVSSQFECSATSTRRELAHKPFIIRDPVHGYLGVAAHERIVVDHPITQRLRRITQTGLAELVFPEARTSRFVHSLGAMHLASRFVLQCVLNADEQDAQALFQTISQLKFFKNFQITTSDLDKLLITDRRAGGGGLESAHVAFHHASLRKDEDAKRYLGLIEAGVRLAALFDDLGHLPFSHDFEYALKDYIGNVLRQRRSVSDSLKSLVPGTPHEMIGHRLAQLVFRALVNNDNPDQATRAAFALALNILNTEERYDEVPRPQVTALGWLHSLVDGQVDVDRADYLLRDGRALGLEFAAYDIERLINNLVMVRDDSLGYVTAIDEKGFSALESFCLSRSRSNQVLVRHHKTAQLAVALRYASVEALKEQSGQEFLQDLERLSSDEKALDNKSAAALLERFSRYDDGWWLEVLRSLQSHDDVVLTESLALILRRQPTFRSLWKRKGDLKRSTLVALNERAKAAKEEPEKFETLRRDLILKHKVLLAIHTFTPYSVLSGGHASQSVLLVLVVKGRYKHLVCHHLSGLFGKHGTRTFTFTPSAC